MTEAKEWTYEKNPNWRPSLGGCLDPLTALKGLLAVVDELPIFEDAENHADLFHAKEAVAAWRQKENNDQSELTNCPRCDDGNGEPVKTRRRVQFRFDENGSVTIEQMRACGHTEFVDIVLRDPDTGEERTMTIPKMK